MDIKIAFLQILHYSKVHICAFDLEKVLDGGERKNLNAERR